MFYFKEIDYDDEIMEIVYKFRCKILCEELKFFNAKDYPNNKEIDKYDKYAKHYVAYDNNSLIAYTRFIYHSPYGYPMTEHMKIDEKYKNLDANKISEISRVFIKKEYRNYKNSKTILKSFMNNFIYPKAKKERIEYFFSALQKNFLLFLIRIKFPFKIIGEEQIYGGKRYPTILNIKDYEIKNPEILDIWRKI